MTGTFSSLSTALSALRYNRVAMDVASGNVANVGTEGYVRRNVVGQTQGAPSVPAMWSRWDGAGNGVAVGGVDRMVDPLLDVRARIEHGTQSALDTKSASLVRLETTLGEPGDAGVAAALTEFQNGWHDVANNPGDEAARSQLLARANTLASALQAQSRSVTTEWSNQLTGVDSELAQVNGLTGDLAALNESIKVADATGTDVNLLLDQRDRITMRLAELVGATTTIGANQTATVTVPGADGQPLTLVDGSTASALTLYNGATAVDAGGQPDYSSGVAAGLTIKVGDADAAITGGSIGGRMELVRQTLPNYIGKLDGFTQTMVDRVNDLHRSGFDLRDPSVAGGNLFTSTEATDPNAAVLDPPVTAATIAVRFDDPAMVAASKSPGTLDGSNATELGNADIGAGVYRELVTDFGVQVASSRRVAASQTVLVGQIDATRESLSGISIDEEMVNLLAAQRAYEGAARVLTTLDSVLDTLINRTGVTR